MTYTMCHVMHTMCHVICHVMHTLHMRCHVICHVMHTLHMQGTTLTMCHVICHVMHTVQGNHTYHVSCDMSCDAHRAGNHTYHVSSSSLVYSSLGMGSPLAVKELPQCYHTSIALTCASVLVCDCGYMTVLFNFNFTYGHDANELPGF